MSRRIDWTKAPEGATHYDTLHSRWYRLTASGLDYSDRGYEKHGWNPSARPVSALTELIKRPVEAKGLEPARSEIPAGEDLPKPKPEPDWSNAPEDLLPEDWFNLTPSNRTAALINAARERMQGPLAGEYRLGMRGLMDYLGLKKLVDIPDHLFDQTRAMVAIRSVSQPTAENDWGFIDGIAKRLIGVTAAEVLQTGVTYAPSPGGHQFPAEGYERLHAVYLDAHHQAAYGKGDERHANGLPFHEQRMQTISQGLNSPDGMAYQVIKKLQEGLQMKDAGARRRELLGALNYLAGIVIFLDDREAGGDV